MLAFGGDTPRHLIISSGGESYVLPAAFHQTEKPAPSIAAVAPLSDGGQRLAVVTGASIGANTRVLFDGVVASARSFDDLTGRLTVVVPPAPDGYKANLTALNSDGQSSTFVQGTNAATYTYQSDALTIAGTPFLNVSPGALPAATEALLQIDAVNTSFAEGQTVVGFGSSDIVVYRIWVVNPGRLLVNVSVSPAAPAGLLNVTIASGLNVLTQASSFQVLPQNPRALWLGSAVTNVNGQPGLSPGSQAVVNVNAPAPLNAGLGLSLLLNDRPVPVTSVGSSQVFFTIPATTPVGQATLRLEYQGERSFPIGIQIDRSGPSIQSISTQILQPIDASRPARPGDMLVLMVNNLEEPGAQVSYTRVSVNVGGIDTNAVQVLSSANQHIVVIVLPTNSPTGAQVPFTVSIDGRASQPFNVPVRGS
jgi:uncharacterized protein (TIGR03437 family)